MLSNEMLTTETPSHGVLAPFSQHEASVSQWFKKMCKMFLTITETIKNWTKHV